MNRTEAWVLYKGCYAGGADESVPTMLKMETYCVAENCDDEVLVKPI